MKNCKTIIALVLTIAAVGFSSCNNTPELPASSTAPIVSDETAVSSEAKSEELPVSEAAPEEQMSSAAEASSASAVSEVGTEPAVGVGDNVEFNGKKWEATYVDDFEGTRLNSKNWTYAPAYKRQDMNNYWNRKQVKFPGNGCVAIGIDQPEGDDRILSGAITTEGIFEQAYGYFECRCRLQPIPGCWSAFWLMCMGETSVGNGGKDGAEIDIVESPFFNSSAVQHNIHWDGYAEDHKVVSSGNVTRPGLYTEFHTYALEWTKNEYIFYIDGEETFRTSEGGICEVPCHMILSIETGSWTGAPDKELLPSEMLVDYVRVYKEA